MLLCVNDIFWTTKIKKRENLRGVMFWAPFYFAALHILD